MIDTDKYEGHTEGPWSFKGPQGLDIENGTHAVVSLYDDPRMRTGGEADMQLIADAPLLLAEVKRLREIEHEWKEMWSKLEDYPDMCAELICFMESEEE